MKILVFAPHNDDEVLGAGGTIARYAQEGHEVYVCEVTSLLSDEVLCNQIKTEASAAHAILGVKKTFFLDLPVVGLRETSTYKKNSAILDIMNHIRPDYVFTPHRGDIHIDHREVTDAVMVACRPVDSPYLKGVLSYETLSETEWYYPASDTAFIPNVYINITATLQQKMQAMNMYRSQLKAFPNPRSIEAITALAKYRGSTACVYAAEAFMLIRFRM